jgi:hypothetical protein
MAVKDREIPLFEQIVGTMQSYPFDFSSVIAGGMAITAYDVAFDPEGIVERNDEASVISSESLLLNLAGVSPGETIVTVLADIGDEGICEALQARVQVKERRDA